jgi:hypothetical protein
MGIDYTYVLSDGSITQLFAPAAVTATANETGVAIPLSKGDAALILENGAITGAPTALTAQLQCSADNSTGWTNVGAAVAIAAAGAQMVSFRPQDQVGLYYRLAFTVTGGSSPSVTVGASIISWNEKN